MSETPAVDDLEVDRLARIVPQIEIDDTRPDYLEPDPEDHEWVELLTADLTARTGIVEPSGDRYVQDTTVLDLDTETAWILGYETAIHTLRRIANGEGLRVSMISIDPEAEPE